MFVHLGIYWTSASRRRSEGPPSFPVLVPDRSSIGYTRLPPQGRGRGPGRSNSCMVVPVTKQPPIHEIKQNRLLSVTAPVALGL